MHYPNSYLMSQERTDAVYEVVLLNYNPSDFKFTFRLPTSFRVLQ